MRCNIVQLRTVFCGAQGSSLPPGLGFPGAGAAFLPPCPPFAVNPTTAGFYEVVITVKDSESRMVKKLERLEMPWLKGFFTDIRYNFGTIEEREFC